MASVRSCIINQGPVLTKYLRNRIHSKYDICTSSVDQPLVDFVFIFSNCLSKI